MGDPADGSRDAPGFPAVEATGVGVQFGGVQALRDVTLAVRVGEIHGLIGPNGAGKSTLVNVLAGAQRRHGGSVRLNGQDVTGTRAQSRARLGLARTFQHPQLAGRLTIGENLDLARRFARSRRGDRSAHEAWSERMLRETELTSWLDVVSHHAPYPVLKIADTVRALLTRPSVLLVDEPAAGLPADDREKLVALLASAQRDVGTTVVLVEHDMPLVFSICERITVLVSGRLLTSGPVAEVQRHPEVIEAYLGVSA